jgi:hypothetical protein
MSPIAPEIEVSQECNFSYASNLEHLCEEMQWLDLRIRLKLLEQEESAVSANHFKGLLLSKEEIDALVAEKSFSDQDDSGAIGSKKRTASRSLESLKSRIENKKTLTIKAGVYLALPRICEIFHLTPFEAGCILVCLAPEIDHKYDSLFAYLQNDITCKKPSINLL